MELESTPSVEPPPEMLFIIGAPRSGTTWLHLLLGAHPHVATGQESQLYEGYLGPLARRWAEELAWPDSDSLRKHGISSYLTEEDFTALLRTITLRVMTTLLDGEPDATHILEKSPNNAFHVALIHRCLPEARFIHMIRDGRDVATSTLKAHEGWGRSWAAGRVEDAAQSWASSVRSAREASDLTDRYIELRYEDLLSDGVTELLRMCEFAGLSITRGEAEETYEAFRFDRLKRGEYSRSTFKNPGVSVASGTAGRKEPPDFFRKGVAGDWKNVLSPADVRAFYWVAGGLLSELGYATPEEVAVASPPLSLRARELRRSIRRGIGTLGRRILGG